MAKRREAPELTFQQQILQWLAEHRIAWVPEGDGP